LGTHANAIPAAAQRLLSIANNNCERLILLINDILDIDKIASRQHALRHAGRTVSQKFCTRLCKLPTLMRSVFNCVLRSNPPTHEVRVRVDADRLLQVLTNCSRTRFKFSPTDDVVTLSSHIGESYVQLRRDGSRPGHTGGVPRPHLRAVFASRLLHRARVGGTGLGLHISRQIVERMHGRIGFEERRSVAARRSGSSSRPRLVHQCPSSNR
jgi:signal transduction histidine kinase